MEAIFFPDAECNFVFLWENDNPKKIFQSQLRKKIERSLNIRSGAIRQI